MLAQKLEVQETQKDDFDLFLENLTEYKTKSDVATVVRELHKDSQGYIASCQKLVDKWNQECYKIDEFEIEEENGYFSLNTFYYKWRKKKYLFEYTSLFTDLDIYNVGLTKEQVIWFLEQDVFGVILPHPTYLMSSGNGLYCIWKFPKSVPARNKEGFNYKVEKLWNVAQNFIYQVLKEYGADANAKDACRVFRADGTFNTKNGEFKKVEILRNYGNEISLDEFRELWMPDYVIKSKVKREYTPEAIMKLKENGKKYGKSLKQLNYTRTQDMISLVNMRNGVCSGLRNYILMIYTYHNFLIDGNLDRVTAETHMLNGLFKEQETESQVNSTLKTCYTAYKEWQKNEMVVIDGKKHRKGYNYTNANIIEMLNITLDEQRQLKTIKCKEIVLENKNNKRKEDRRNENGKTSREQQKQDNINKIKEMKAKGMNNTLIADTLGLSRQTVSKYANM